MNIRLATKQESKDNVIGTSRIGYVDSSFGNLKALLGFPNVIDATSGGSNIALDPSVLTNSPDNKVHFEWHVIVNHGDLLKELFMTIYGYKLFDSYGEARSIDESIDYGWSIGADTEIGWGKITSIVKDALTLPHDHDDTFPHKINDALAGLPDVTFELNMREVRAMQKENEELKKENKESEDCIQFYNKLCVVADAEIKKLKKEIKEVRHYWKNIKENEVAIKYAEIRELKEWNDNLSDERHDLYIEIQELKRENAERRQAMNKTIRVCVECSQVNNHPYFNDCDCDTEVKE